MFKSRRGQFCTRGCLYWRHLVNITQGVLIALFREEAAKGTTNDQEELAGRDLKQSTALGNPVIAQLVERRTVAVYSMQGSLGHRFDSGSREKFFIADTSLGEIVCWGIFGSLDSQ